MKRVIGIGNALTDVLVNLRNEDVLHNHNIARGSMSLVDSELQAEVSKEVAELPHALSLGGSADNTIRAMARLGSEVGFIGKVGHDNTGDRFEQALRNLGIEGKIFRGESPSGKCISLVSPDGERTMLTYLGAAAEMHAEDISADIFEGYDCLYIEGYLVQDHDLICRAVEMAHAAGLKVCLDLASYNIVEAQHEFFSYLLDHTDIVFANEEEALAFTGKGPREALDLLAQRCEVAVVKTGKEGAMARRGEEFAQAPAEPVAQVVDTTAAGDFFAAGFLYRHAQGAPLADCLVAGGAVAGAVIQVVGTQLADQTWDALRQRLGA